MPLFKKSPSDTAYLSETNRKVLRRCRILLIKDLDAAVILDIMGQDDGFRPEVRDQILSYPSREQRVGIFLDRLESRGDRAFSLFMDSLRENYKHLHYVLEETIRTADEGDDCKPRDRIALTGETVRKILRYNIRRRTDLSTSSESAEELELINEEVDEGDYIPCFSIPLRGKQQQESWIKHECGPSLETEEEVPDHTYMASMKKDVILKRIQRKDIPEGIKLPPKHCHLFVIDHDYAKVKRDSENKKGETSASLDDATDEAPEMQAPDIPHEEIDREGTPPPVPPKPEHLPNLNVKPPGIVPRGKGEKSKVIPASEKPDILPKPPELQEISQKAKKGNTSTTTKQAKREEPKRSESPPPPVPTRNKSMKESTPPLHKKNQNEPTPPLHKKNQNEPTPPTEKKLKSTSMPPGKSNLESPEEENKEVNGGPNFERLLSNVSEESAVSEAATLVDESETKEVLETDLDAVESKTVLETDLDAVESKTDENKEETNDVKLENGVNDNEELTNGFAEVDHSEIYEPYAHDEQPSSTTSTLKAETSPKVSPTESSSSGVCEDTPKTSGDSVEFHNGKSTIAGTGSIKSSIDSGIDTHVQAKQNNGAQPVCLVPRSSTDPAVNKIERKESHRRSTKRTPMMLPRSMSDVQVFLDNVSSDEDSYYEDIDGERGASPKGSVSYLDPKSYNKYAEQAFLNKTSPWIHTQSTAFVSELEASGKVRLGKDELVIAEIEEACINCPIQGAGEEEEVVVDIYKDFRGTTLVFDKHGRAYYIPEQCLKKHGDPEGEPWFYPIEISSRQATLLLSSGVQEGCFVVYRPPNKTCGYNMSVSRGNGNIVHYRVLENKHGDVMIEHHDHSFMNIGELVDYFQRNKSQLATRLRRPIREANMPITPGYHYDMKWEVSRKALSISGKIIGKGDYGVICAGTLERVPVSVKVLQKNNLNYEDIDDFIEEAQILMKMNHEQILRFVGLSVSERPFFLITEYVHGNLRDAIREQLIPADDIDVLFDVCMQISSALNYMEGIRYIIHRDLAASTFLMTEDRCIKLSEFGKARHVVDDYYQASKQEVISVRWAAPEVLSSCSYSTKSDVWAMGVVFWEVFSGGELPWGSLSGEQTCVYVTEGGRLEKPPGCSPDLFGIMKSCWKETPRERPSFSAIYEKLQSKISIYTGTLQEPQIASSPVKKLTTQISQPLKSPAVQSSKSFSGASAVKTKPATPTIKNRKTVSIDPLAEDYAKEMVDGHLYREDSYNFSKQGSQDRLSASSSELSIVSAKDDLSRSDKIRKSLRKMINPNKTKRKLSKLDLPSVKDGKYLYE